jgi:hypothetical protein
MILATLFSGTAPAIILCFGIITAMELDRRLALRRTARHPEQTRAGVGAVEGAVFALLGLLIAFTFQGAAARFDGRRQLILNETNALSTAWSQLDVLPAGTQAPLRDLFRRHLASRLEIYRWLPDLSAARKALETSNALQQEIWTAAVAACQTEAGRPLTVFVLPPLNQLFDLATARTISMRTHPPLAIFASVSALALICSLLAGSGMAAANGRNWNHMLVLPASYCSRSTSSSTWSIPDPASSAWTPPTSPWWNFASR